MERAVPIFSSSSSFWEGGFYVSSEAQQAATQIPVWVNSRVSAFQHSRTERDCSSSGYGSGGSSSGLGSREPVLTLGIRNGGGKQPEGHGNQPPYRQDGPEMELQHRRQKQHRLAKPSRILSKSEADTEFRYRPHIVDADTIADAFFADARELKNIYHHHPEGKKINSSEGNSRSIQPYGRYGNAGKASKTISTKAILWPVKAVFEKRAATVEVDTFISPGRRFRDLYRRFRFRFGSCAAL